MESYHFRVCGINLNIQASRPLVTGGDMTPFLCENGPADLTIFCRAVDEVPAPGGTPGLRDAEHLVCSHGAAVHRCRTKRLDDPPYARLDYNCAAPGRAELAVRAEDWRWCTDHMRLWSTVYLPQLLLPYRTLVFHAAYIGWQGRGILFTAPSGTGKSTQAELWRALRGSEVLNGDKAGVSLRESPMAHSMPFSGTSGICRNVSLPLRAIVVLSQAPENTVRRLGPSAAVSALCANLFADQGVPEEWQAALGLLLDLAAAVPVYALACTPDERAVETLERALTANAL